MTYTQTGYLTVPPERPTDAVTPTKITVIAEHEGQRTEVVLQCLQVTVEQKWSKDPEEEDWPPGRFVGPSPAPAEIRFVCDQIILDDEWVWMRVVTNEAANPLDFGGKP